MKNIKDKIEDFFHSDTSIGILLFVAAFLAIIFENSALSGVYHFIQHFEITVAIGEIVLAYDLHYWVNECLMVLFFLLVGLEIKREFLTGQLASIHYVVLPAVAAIGGIIVPAAIFLLFNSSTFGINGWAIPAATDIAFAVGLIALFGNRLPSNVKLFILTLAVIDDIGAVLIIAIFYSDSINLVMLGYAVWSAIVMAIMNMLNIRALTPYMLIGILTWYFMLKTGIHPTLAGIVVAACVPLRVKPDPRLPYAFGMNLGETRLGYVSPAIKLEASLHRSVSFAILPLFAFMNSGLNIAESVPAGSVLSAVFTGVTGGVFWGLFIGKPVGVLGGAFLWKFLSKKEFPSQIDSHNILGMGFICGIGFTMSILISVIAYEGNDAYINNALFGILLGSCASGIAASLVFWSWIRRRRSAGDADAEDSKIQHAAAEQNNQGQQPATSVASAPGSQT